MTDDRPLGDTAEAHDELSPHDLPMGHPGRPAALRQPRGRGGTTRGDQDLADAARVMEDKQIRRLVVLSQDKRLVGIVSLGDLATRGLSAAITEEVVEAVSEPTRHE